MNSPGLYEAVPIKDLVRMPAGVFMYYELPQTASERNMTLRSHQSYATRAGAKIIHETFFAVSSDGEYCRPIVKVTVVQQGTIRWARKE